MNQGFTLLELMIAIAIITFLSMLSLPSLMRTLARSKRTEAYLYLRTLAQAQRVYYAEYGTYTPQLSGSKSLGWIPEGSHLYTYGFSGSQEGIGHFVGSSGVAASALVGTKANGAEFVMAAAGTIYGEAVDLLTIDQTGTIRLVHDGLAG